MQPLLEAGTPPRDEQDYELLRRKVQRLEDEAHDLRDALKEARQSAGAALRSQAKLRQQLEPLYTALRMVFGELETLTGTAETGASTTPRESAVWESWKRKLGGKQAEFIEAMLEHGHDMTAEQLRVATHTGRSTVPQIIYKLNQLGLINKNGGKFSLKEL